LSAAGRLGGPLAAQLGPALGDWLPIVERFAASAAGRRLFEAVDERVRNGAVVYPAQVFKALEATPLAATRVVMLGQDPYHGPGQAEGLAFSVPAGVALPPSLRNILLECQRDLGIAPPASGSLMAWAKRGVLLLNTSLTVEDGQPGRHSKLGWQTLTAAILQAAVDDSAPKVFMLWGAHAQALGRQIGIGAPHACLLANHPSPLSARRPPAPFVGCGHFGQAARFLAAAGRGSLDWSLCG
jgi:uracil-DNA glycosylase